jgi:hypothetical protein
VRASQPKESYTLKRQFAVSGAPYVRLVVSQRVLPPWILVNYVRHIPFYEYHTPDLRINGNYSAISSTLVVLVHRPGGRWVSMLGSASARFLFSSSDLLVHPSRSLIPSSATLIEGALIFVTSRRQRSNEKVSSASPIILPITGPGADWDLEEKTNESARGYLIDGSLLADADVGLTVNGVNHIPFEDPTNGPIADVTVSEDAPDTVIDLWDHFEDVEDGLNLTYIIVGTPDPALFESVSIGSDGHTLRIDCRENSHGSEEIAIRGTDHGDGSDPTRLSVDETFSVIVNAVNDAPEVMLPGSVTLLEDTSEGIDGISVFDLDFGTAPDSNNTLKVLLSVSNGTLTIDPAGVNVTAGANESSGITFTGTQAAVNDALSTLTCANTRVRIPSRS